MWFTLVHTDHDNKTKTIKQSPKHAPKRSQKDKIKILIMLLNDHKKRQIEINWQKPRLNLNILLNRKTATRHMSNHVEKSTKTKKQNLTMLLVF